MLYILYSLNTVLMIGLPIALGVFLTRRFKLGWGLWWVGAATFILSQVVHLPLLWGLTAAFKSGALPNPPEAWTPWFNAVVLGLAAGVCEEVARYLVLRFWIKSARSGQEVLVFGAGHGGIEAILLGALAGYTTIQLFALQNTDLSALHLSAEQLTALQQQLAAFTTAPWYATLLGALERIFALCIHLSATVLVWQAFRRNNLLWLGAAILWHAVVDGASVMAVSAWGPYGTEALVAGFAAAGLLMVWVLKPYRDVPAAEPVTLLPSTAPARPANPAADLKEKLDDSRFNS